MNIKETMDKYLVEGKKTSTRVKTTSEFKAFMKGYKKDELDKLKKSSFIQVTSTDEYKDDPEMFQDMLHLDEISKHLKTEIDDIFSVSTETPGGHHVLKDVVSKGKTVTDMDFIVFINYENIPVVLDQSPDEIPAVFVAKKDISKIIALCKK